MESGLWRCVHQGRHDEHYFAYYRAMTTEERLRHGFARTLFCADCEEAEAPCICTEATASATLDEDDGTEGAHTTSRASRAAKGVG